MTYKEYMRKGYEIIYNYQHYVNNDIVIKRVNKYRLECETSGIDGRAWAEFWFAMGKMLRNVDYFIDNFVEAQEICIEEENKYFFSHCISIIYGRILGDDSECKRWSVTKEDIDTRVTDKEKIEADYDEVDAIIDRHIYSEYMIIQKYKNVIKNRDNRLTGRDYLGIFKGFSSSVPIMVNAFTENQEYSQIKGGGYFIKWNNCGIAIDPGLNFIENMHKSKITILDIDYIFVTHYHIDHYGDLRSLSDLIHQCNADRDNKDGTVCKNVTCYCDRTTYRNCFNDSSLKHINFIEVDTERTEKTEVCPGISYTVIRTVHDSRLDGTYAIKFELVKNDLHKIKIGFTSDTKYIQEVSDFVNDCNILIANISDVNESDLKRKEFKKNHLGYNGCFEILKNIQEDSIKYFIISEFWAGKGDIRIPIAKKLKRESGKNIKVLPGDIGLIILLDNNKVICSICKNEIDLSKVNVINSNVKFGALQYVCDNCSM